MIVSINWLKEIIDFKSNPKQLEEGLTALGLECTYKTENELSFTNIVVGQVLSVEKVKDSDHLNLCLVQIDKEEKEIVCGAENIKSDILVPVAVPGATLGHGKFKIKKTKIRGVTSNGMICSEKELGISDNHDGIMILNSNDYKIGEKFEPINSKSNDCLDIDLTPNRGDCFSHVGVAREISILENIQIKDEEKTLDLSDFTSKVKVEIQDSDACSRYSCRVVKGIKVSESPKWLKNKLESIGQKSINNVVDAANYTLFHFGHPMHTFDLDKIDNSTIIVKKSDKEETVKCLDGIDRKITKEHLLISDRTGPLAIAGIMGLENSSVTSETKDILIESAYFDPVTIRRGAKLLDLSTDASKRFERDTDINNIISSLDFLATLIKEVAGGEICKDIVDSYPNKKPEREITFDLDNCNALLGTSIDLEESKTILNSLSIKTKDVKGGMICNIPSYRNDLDRSVDLYEEIARVYGYDNIKSVENFNCSYSTIENDKNNTNKYISTIFSMNGFNEHYSNSLYSDYETSLFTNNMDVEIDNPLSSDMKFLRNSIIPGLMKAVNFNINHGNKNFKLFEVGAIHKKIIAKKINNYIQENSLGIAWCSLSKKDWKNNAILDIYDVKGEIQNIFNMLNFEIDFKEKNGLLELSISNKKIGHLMTPDYLDTKLLKGKPNVYFAELNMDIVSKIYSQNNKKDKIKTPSPYPTIERDVSILISKDVHYENISKEILKSAGILLKDISLFDLYIDKSLDKDKHSLSISLLFSSDERTLKDNEVDEAMNRIIESLKNKFNITQR